MSTLIINSIKSEKIFSCIKDDFLQKKLTLEQLIESQKHITQSLITNPNRNKVLKLNKRKNINELCRKYSNSKKSTIKIFLEKDK